MAEGIGKAQTQRKEPRTQLNIPIDILSYATNAFTAAARVETGFSMIMLYGDIYRSNSRYGILSVSIIS